LIVPPWSQAKKVFDDAVLWRLAPVQDRYSTSITLDPDWQHNDRSAAWFVWYADPAGENWFMISISGKSIAKRDIGTRGSVISMDASWPRQSTAVSIKDAAAAAAKQGANNLDRVLNCMMGWAIFWTAQDMVKDLASNMIRAEKEELTKALEHEPNQENWQYYHDLKCEKANRQKVLQKEIDREKIHRLVFGEEDNDSKAS
jgi:hypothetical protein